jgi:lysine-specific demethylase 8
MPPISRSPTREPLGIPRLHLPEVDEFRERFATRRRPVVITGAMDGWPALGRWSPKDFAERLGDLEVQAITSDEGKDGVPLSPEELTRTRLEKLPMRDFLVEVASGPVRRYVSGMSMKSGFGVLLDEIEPPPYREPGSSTPPRLWLGRVVGPLHYDPCDNLHGIVHGKKRFTLFAARELRNLYPSSMLSYVPTMSRLSLAEPDYARFPRLRKARPLVVDLEPGELLFIPAGWWHQVTAPVVTISIDFPWSTMPRWGWPFWRLFVWQALVRFRGRLGASSER